MSFTRRDFLQTTIATTAGLAFPSALLAKPQSDVKCLFLVLVGGPSQLDTWDPKPKAPSEVRGPYQPLRTAVPGLHLSELFPRMAAKAKSFSVLRSVYHEEAPIHETGLQLLQTGKVTTETEEAPHLGARLSPTTSKAPTNVLFPGSLGFTGLSIGHGQTAGNLGAAREPQTPLVDIHADPLRDKYGRTTFGDDCLRACRCLEQGANFATVNMFSGVYDTLSWDCHAAGGSLNTTLDDYRSIAPMFDMAYSAVLDDLAERGLLEKTLVVATGEFGRTPKLNRQGGRDHWSGVWSMLLAGAGVPGGEIIGSSDHLGAEPKDSPMSAAQVHQFIRTKIGV